MKSVTINEMSEQEEKPEDKPRVVRQSLLGESGVVFSIGCYPEARPR